MDIINNIDQIRNDIVPDVIDIEIQEINRNEIRDDDRNNRYVPNISYYVWYCGRHGDCFLTSINRMPENHESRCGVLNQCYYDYLGFLSLENGVHFFPDRNINLREFFENNNNGYTVDMFENMINSPNNRNGVILY